VLKQHIQGKTLQYNQSYAPPIIQPVGRVLIQSNTSICFWTFVANSGRVFTDLRNLSCELVYQICFTPCLSFIVITPSHPGVIDIITQYGGVFIDDTALLNEC
jgi:hypothetical protein